MDQSRRMRSAPTAYRVPVPYTAFHTAHRASTADLTAYRAQCDAVHRLPRTASSLQAYRGTPEPLDNSLSFKLPSPSTIRRSEFALDVSMMLLERERSESQVDGCRIFKFGWSDSSPMGGYLRVSQVVWYIPRTALRCFPWWSTALLHYLGSQ